MKDLVESNERITYGEMSDVVAEDWNKEGKQQITGEQVWEALAQTSFPALWGRMMYSAAKSGDLVGLLLTDETCAKIFWKMLDNLEKK